MQTEIFVADVSPLNDDRLFAGLYSRVPQYRRDKIDRFRFRESKNLSLGAGFLLSYAIGKNGYDESILQIKTNENGKPFFVNENNLFFSLSHSGTIAVCVLSDRETGIDVEEISRANIKLAKRFFSEKDNLLIDSSSDKSKTFTELWTKKESYAKFKGTSLDTVLKQDEFTDCFFKSFDFENCIITLCCSYGENKSGILNLTEVQLNNIN